MKEIWDTIREVSGKSGYFRTTDLKRRLLEKGIEIDPMKLYSYLDKLKKAGYIAKVGETRDKIRFEKKVSIWMVLENE